ncbi:P-loop containing nucleoside triphosphate hydrolase protein [Elaphomyces granulatus]
MEFFSREGEHLGNKKSLERHIHEVTGIPVKSLRGSPLSHFSVPERMLWAEKRETIREEDKAYSLLCIFDVYMPLIYGEGRENAFKRLREEMDKASKGTKRDDFSVAFSLSNVSEIEQFVAREEELGEIHRTLRGDGSRRIVVLHGLGGIGKTQLSVAYAKRHKDNYSAIFWLNIKDEDSLKQSLAKVVKRILREHPSARRLCSVDIKENIDEVIDGVNEWLSLPNNTRWLMIYDNYDNPKSAGNTDSAAVDIRKYLPESYQDPDAVKLAKGLDGLPLALLATAGAYLYQVTISFSDHLRLYKTSWAKLLTTSPEINSYEDRMLYSTWQVSFDQVKQRNELSAKLLQLWAYFDNQDLWFELLRHSDSEDPDWIRELTEDELGFNGAVRVLKGIAFTAVFTHGCVHSWAIHVLNQKWDYDLARLARLALKFVGSHFPWTESKWWLTERRLLPHAARCSHAVLNGMVIDDGMEWALYNLGNLCGDQGKLTRPRRCTSGHCKDSKRRWAQSLDTVNNLGVLYADQGKLDEAEKMYQRALQGFEKALGPGHTSTLESGHGQQLGYSLCGPGQAGRGREDVPAGTARIRKALGPGHTSTLLTVNNLGLLYADQGKLDEAEEMY